MPADTVYLIDATSLCYRSFFAVKLSTAKGSGTGAVFGYYNTLKKIINRFEPVYMAACFDVSRKTWRSEKFKDYKIHRKPVPDDLKAQIPLVKRLTLLMGITLLEQEGYEADDILGVLTGLAKQKGLKAVVVTSDKDMNQLLCEGGVEIYNPAKDEMITEKSFTKKMGFEPRFVPDYLALMGDASDNIPGAKGIGEKGASKLVQEFSSVENIYKHLEKIAPKTAALLSQSREDVFLSKELALLQDCPLDATIDDLKIKARDEAGLKAMFKELEFVSLIKEETSVPAGEAALQEIGPGELKKIVRDNTLTFFIKEGKAYFYGGEALTFFCPVAAAAPLFMDEKIKKISHDLKTQMLENKIEINHLAFDTRVAAYLLDAAYGDYALESLAAQHLGIAIKDNPALYPCAIFRLYEIFRPQLKDAGMEKLFCDIEMPLVSILKDMQDAGVKIDIAAMEKLLGSIDNKIDHVGKKIFALAKKEFNLNSPKQMAEVLFVDLKIKPVKKTKTGYSTNEDVLLALAQEHKIADDILEHRQLNKLKNTYVLPILEAVKAGDGKIHAQFNQTTAATGRLSSSNPNLQSIPAKGELAAQLREAFVPSHLKGFLISGDYSQIELRILAHYSQDENLLKAFTADEDIHAFTARLIFGVGPDQAEKKRDIAKRVNFAVLYGMGAYSLARELKVPVQEAQAFIDGYFARYPKVKDYMNRVYTQLEEKGFVTTILNRKRRLPDFTSPNAQMREFARRQAVNTPIQGSCADLIKTAMVKIYFEFKKHNLKSKMVIQIHDELVFDVVPDEADKVISIVREKMQNALKLSVPVKVNIEKGANWALMKEAA